MTLVETLQVEERVFKQPCVAQRIHRVCWHHWQLKFCRRTRLGVYLGLIQSLKLEKHVCLDLKVNLNVKREAYINCIQTQLSPRRSKLNKHISLQSSLFEDLFENTLQEIMAFSTPKRTSKITSGISYHS